MGFRKSDDKSVKIWRVTDWALEHEISEPFNLATTPTFFTRLRFIYRSISIF
jgi:hypothetical protein